MKKRRTRVALLVLIAGGVGSLVLAVSMLPSVAAFTASIQNSTNTAGSGTLIMQETQGTNPVVTCTSTDATGGVSDNAAVCSTINKYGGDRAMVPGQSVVTTINIANIGTTDAATFTLDAGTCTQSSNSTPNGTATDLCNTMTVTITSGATTVFTGTLAEFDTEGPISLTALAADAEADFTFGLELPSTSGNKYQGLKVSQPMTWTFTAAT